MEHIQLDLFRDREREKTDEVFLEASESAKKAFYHVWIERLDEGFIVRKESGIFNKVMDRRDWWFKMYPEAKEYHQKLIREKTNPSRKSPRKYIIRHTEIHSS
jgi:hypothetical protein